MQRERTLLDWPLLVGLCAVTIDLMIGRPHVQQAPPPAPPVETVRVPAAAPPDPDAELREQYHRELAMAFDDAALPIEAFDALRRARSLDVVLDGGARSDELTARMRIVAPRAVVVYLAVGDATGAELARHTAEFAGAP